MHASQRRGNVDTRGRKRELQICGRSAKPDRSAIYATLSEPASRSAAAASSSRIARTLLRSLRSRWLKASGAASATPLRSEIRSTPFNLAKPRSSDRPISIFPRSTPPNPARPSRVRLPAPPLSSPGYPGLSHLRSTNVVDHHQSPSRLLRPPAAATGVSVVPRRRAACCLHCSAAGATPSSIRSPLGVRERVDRKRCGSSDWFEARDG